LPAVDVYADLKATAELPRREWYWQCDGELESALLARKEPLIDLALARYGIDKNTVAQIFARTKEASDPITVGTRLACLSNEVVDWFSAFPASIVSEQDISAILSAEDDREAAALLANPRIDDNLLANLFARGAQFAALPEERWLRLVALASDNKRIVTCEDTDDGPDMGHYRIQKAILELLKNAPLFAPVMHMLYNLLTTLDPFQTHGDGELEPTLARWSTVETKNYKGEPEQGHYTDLTFAQEFRCLIGALYGKSYVNTETSIAGSPDAADPALRAAYYGNAILSDNEMHAANKKDGSMFVFAALWNTSLFYNDKSRKFFEEQFLAGRALAAFYRQRLLQLKSQWPNADIEPVVDWVKEDASPNEQAEFFAPVINYETQFRELGRRIGALEGNLLWGLIIILAALLYLRH
jgi:hypothetical protein